MAKAVRIPCIALWIIGAVLHTHAADSPAPSHKLLVLATIAPMYCFTKNVAGELADVELIVPPGIKGGPSFKPSPDQVRNILQADVIIENGFGFEQWMDQLEARGLKPGAIRVIAARGTGPGIPGLPGDPDSPPGDAPADLTRPPDPHVWLDPVMAIKEVQNIRDALMARDPQNADAYLANENRYEAALRDLDDAAGQLTVDIPKRRLVCYDSSFNYFLSRYEFDVVDVITGAFEKSDSQPGDAFLAPLGTAPANLNRQALPIVLADPMETAPAPLPPPDYYEKTTLSNARALRKVLMR